MAKRAVFERNAEGKEAVVLRDGSTQEFDGDKTALRVVAFDKLLVPATELGGGPTRGYTVVDELGPVGFVRERSNSFRDPAEARSWTREAIKRFGIPALVLIHALLGLELLAAWGTMSSRQRHPVAAICAIIASFHVAVVLATEQIGWALPWAWAAIARDRRRVGDGGYPDDCQDEKSGGCAGGDCVEPVRLVFCRLNYVAAVAGGQEGRNRYRGRCDVPAGRGSVAPPSWRGPVRPRR